MKVVETKLGSMNDAVPAWLEHYVLHVSDEPESPGQQLADLLRSKLTPEVEEEMEKHVAAFEASGLADGQFADGDAVAKRLAVAQQQTQWRNTMIDSLLATCRDVDDVLVPLNVSRRAPPAPSALLASLSSGEGIRAAGKVRPGSLPKRPEPKQRAAKLSGDEEQRLQLEAARKRMEERNAQAALAKQQAAVQAQQDPAAAQQQRGQVRPATDDGSDRAAKRMREGQ